MHKPDFNILYFSETESTNLQASALLSERNDDEAFVVYSGYQSNGKGQGNTVWHSAKTKNLLCSICLFPQFLPIEKQFYISKLSALALYDLLSSETENLSIKWPNDMMAGERKLAGILIENSIREKTILRSIIGIGININQTEFPDFPLPATSLKKECGKEYSIEGMLNSFLDHFSYWYNILEHEDFDQIDRQYMKRLYRFHKLSRFRTPEGEFDARIIGVKSDGRIILEGEKDLLYFGFKEIEYL